MAPTPSSERGAPAQHTQEQPRGNEAAQRPPPERHTGTAAVKPQRPQAHERAFAPGEDGECH